MEHLNFVTAQQENHFEAMSLIHALGWRTTYQGAVPSDYMAREITNSHWVSFFRENYRTDRCTGLLLYRDGTPVACCNFGPAREDAFVGWGEIISFYTHPAEKARGYGGQLMTEALRRLRMNSFKQCYVLVLRENAKARRFYSSHGFSWDGSHVDIPFPPNTICTDLRYTKRL